MTTSVSLPQHSFTPASEMLPRASVCGVQPVRRRCVLHGGVSATGQAWVPLRGWASPVLSPALSLTSGRTVLALGTLKHRHVPLGMEAADQHPAARGSPPFERGTSFFS